MKIAFLTDTLALGGRQRQLAELLRGLHLEANVEPHVIMLSREMHYDYAREFGVPFHIVPRWTRRDPSVFFRLAALLRRIRPDILHSFEPMCSIYAIPAVKLLGLPFVNGCIRGAPPMALANRWNRIRLTIPFSDVVMANSKAGLAVYRVPQEKAICIYNGFDFSRTDHLPDPQTIRQELGLTEPLVVGMVAEFHERKAYGAFLELARLATNERTDVCFVAVGDGPDFEAHQRQAREMAIPRLHFLGRRKKVETIINALDVGVLLTNIRSGYGEGISNAIMEYMACRKPVVATDAGGNPELVEDEKTGLLVQDNQPEKLLAALKTLLDHPDRARGMGQAGRERLEQLFSLERMTREHLALYQRLAKGAR